MDFYRTAKVSGVVSAGLTIVAARSEHPLEGEVVSVVLQSTHDASATLDAVLKVVGDDGQPDQALTTYTNGALGHRRPLIQATDTAGAAITGVYVAPYIRGYVQLDVAQGEQGDVVTAWVTVRRS